MTEKKTVKKKTVKKEPEIKPIKEKTVEEKAPVKKAVAGIAIASLPIKIRMLMSLANSAKSYEVGHVYIVGIDLSLETAENWTKNGIAVEVKDVGPEETK